MDVRGETLFVGTVDGHHFRVDRADLEGVQALQATAAIQAQAIELSAGGDTLATRLLMAATTLFPVLLVALLLIVAARIRRRPPQATEGLASS